MPETYLTRIYRRLLASARADGQAHAHELYRGARISVRVRDGQVELCLSRWRTPVGETELVTFCKHCAVPEGATRVPPEGQKTQTERGGTRHYVIYRWPETADMFAREDTGV